ncbi:carboxypeptidase-like regulatory domain-containing protein [Ekhidna sp.]|uniref:TonB-dependent receptor n=1 Tax=Ekhidna sp. TaxID=2608089 RepID=UPI003511A2E5
MKKFLLLIAAIPLFISAQEKYTINGYIKDASNGEALIGATVLIKELNTGNITNVYGFYSVTIPPGDYTVEFRYIGFVTQSRAVSLTENTRIDIELSEEQTQLEEVVVTAKPEDENVTSTEMSVAELDIQVVRKMPAILGEVDIIKSLQLLPGVTSVGEGSSGFNVRGGNVGQNLVLLDEAPVYNSSHMLGFFSVFNPDAVKDMKLYKGGIPAQFGGRLASILDIRMKEGNNKKTEFNGGIGTIFSRFSVEAPIKKEKSSFIIAGRRSYADILARPFVEELRNGAALNFYDLTAKTNFQFSDRDQLFLSGYFGQDNFKFDADQGFNWGNRTSTVRWNHLFNDRLFSNFTFFFSDYEYELAFGDNPRDKFKWNSDINTLALKPSFTYFIDQKNEFTFGGEIFSYTFEPAQATGISDGEAINLSLPNRKAIETALYVNNEQRISDDFSLQYGLRFSYFNLIGAGNKFILGDTIPGRRRPVEDVIEVPKGESIAKHHGWEPRLSLKYQLNRTTSVKASYNRMLQYIHLISNTTASNPLDVWTPSSNNLKPQIGQQWAIGLFKNLKNNQYETSVELYYRKTEQQVEYINGADLLINEALEADLLTGDGRAYGLELYVKKLTGRLNGWVSYTLGRTELQATGINKGEWYPTRYDQTHNLKLTGFYEINDRWSLSSTFSYLSGTPTTFPTHRYEVQGITIPHNSDDSRNNVRLPDYHRLDFSAIRKGRTVRKDGTPRKNRDELVFTVYNIYNRANPFSIYFWQGADRVNVGERADTRATQVSIFASFIPSITYNFKF